jgi:hypothetical protein
MLVSFILNAAVGMGAAENGNNHQFEFALLLFFFRN